MSQKSLLVASILALVLVMSIEIEAKRIGCASFGHSCYGGHGKRSDPSLLQEIDTSEQQQPPLPMLRILQRRFNIQQANESPANEVIENEKEGKLMILNVMRDVVDETYRRLTTAKEQDIPA